MSNTPLQHTIPSEEKIEAFLRGEGPLEFRSEFQIDIDNARLVTRQTDDDSEPEQQFLAVRGVATTAETDDNGVEVIGNALRSMPDDFSKRTTVLFNHDFNMPIGRLLPNESTKFIGGRNARVEVDPVLIDTDVRLQTGQRVVDAIERGTLSKFSFAWSTRDGVVVFTRDFFASATDDELEDMGVDPEEDVAFSFRIGVENAPRVRVFSLTAVELSVVSVPADAGAGFGMASFSRNLERALSRYSQKSGGQILIPENYQRQGDGELVIPITAGRAASRALTPSAYEKLSRESQFQVNVPFPSKETIQEVEEQIRAIAQDEAAKVMAKRDMPVPATVGMEGSVDELKTPTISRPWDVKAAWNRVKEFAGQHETREVGTAIRFQRMGLLHHDVVDGELVSSKTALDACAREFETVTSDLPEETREGVRRHLYREYTEIHGVAPEDVPAVLREHVKNASEEGGDQVSE